MVSVKCYYQGFFPILKNNFREREAKYMIDWRETIAGSMMYPNI